MGEQVQTRAIGQRPCEHERVVDRAGHERGVLEAVDPLAVAREQLAHLLGVVLPQLAERAVGVGEGAVQQHQDRLVGMGGGWDLRDWLGVALERGGKAVRREGIQTGVHLVVHPRGDLGGGDARGRFQQQAGDHLDGREQHIAQPPARGPARSASLLQPLPAQLRGHLHFSGAAVAWLDRHAAAREAGLRQHQVTCGLGVQHERGAVADVQHHRVQPGPCGHAHGIAAAPGSTHLHALHGLAASAEARRCA